MSNLIDYAKEELKRIGMIDSGEPYNDWATKAILDLIELFASQDHSGFTAPYVVNAFSRLAMFKPLSALTGEDDEWHDCGHGCLQNKRYSAVFKEADGVAYNIDGKVFTDDGEIWYGCKESRINVTFPYVVPDKPERVYRNKETNDELTQYQRDLTRMWNSLRTKVYKGARTCSGVECAECPFADTVCKVNDSCWSFNAEKAIEIVTQWAKAHPVTSDKEGNNESDIK